MSNNDTNSTIQITFGGKQVTVRQLTPYICQKSNTVFYIKDTVSGAWLYCSDERLQKLHAKLNGDFSHYTGRGSKLSAVTVPAFLKSAVEAEAEEVMIGERDEDVIVDEELEVKVS